MFLTPQKTAMTSELITISQRKPPSFFTRGLLCAGIILHVIGEIFDEILRALDVRYGSLADIAASQSDV
jgi:hypothetical protein